METLVRKTYPQFYNWYMAQFATQYDYEMLCIAAANYATAQLWELKFPNVPAPSYLD